MFVSQWTVCCLPVSDHRILVTSPILLPVFRGCIMSHKSSRTCLVKFKRIFMGWWVAYHAMCSKLGLIYPFSRNLVRCPSVLLKIVASACTRQVVILLVVLFGNMLSQIYHFTRWSRNIAVLTYVHLSSLHLSYNSFTKCWAEVQILHHLSRSRSYGANLALVFNTFFFLTLTLMLRGR